MKRNGNRSRRHENVRLKVAGLALVVALAPTKADALSPDRFALALPDSRMEIGVGGASGDGGKRTVTVIAGGRVVSLPEEWEALAVDNEEFVVRHKDWRGWRLHIDCASGAVSRARGDELTVPAATGRELVEGASCKAGAPGVPRVVNLPAVALTCRTSEKLPRLELATRTGALALSRAEGWEVEEAGVALYRLRRREWPKGAFWEVDGARRAARSAGGERGDLAGDDDLQAAAVRVEFIPKGAREGLLARKDPAVRKKVVKDDPRIEEVRMMDYERAVRVVRAGEGVPKGMAPLPPSRWRDREQELFARALAGAPCEILVAPFQVQGYALDRIERALVTRYLSRALASSGLHLPNPTLVARALGEGARVLPDEKVFQLADALGAKTLVTGYIGHDREERLQVTILVRRRQGATPFAQGVEPALHSWDDISFSDERLPSEAFLGILGDVVPRIVPGAAGLPAPVQVPSQDDLAVPANLGAATGGGGASPARDAFLLQLLGLLAKTDGAVAESLFERSLVALLGVAPDSPDYRLLKAGAYAALARRPAALAALGKPRSAEEQALGAFLNGDLAGLEESTARITRPVPRLMARIRLNDLRQRYGADSAVRTREIDALIKEFPGLGGLLASRLEEGNIWAKPSAFPLKEGLDRLFPLAGQRLEELLARGRALGESTSEDAVDQAIFNHYHQVVPGGHFPAEGSRALVPGDALDLLFEASVREMLRRVGGPIMVQGLPEAGLESVAVAERLYPEHPALAYIKMQALGTLSQRVGGEAASRMAQEAQLLAQSVYLWGEGQSPAVAAAAKRIGPTPLVLPSYDADYPRRPYWRYETVGDRRHFGGLPEAPSYALLQGTTRQELKNAFISLSYTTDDVSILKGLHRKLLDVRLPTEAAAVLEANRHRFQGHALWPDLLAQAAEGDAAAASARRVYEQAIAENPLSWDPYFELGRILIGEGDFGGASRLYQSFPLFREPGPEDRVGLSHAAYGAGVELLFHGATEEATPLLEIAAGLGTGSGSELGALSYLAQLRGDFVEAALRFRNRGTRYRHRGSYGRTIAYLHLLGGHEEAAALFDSLNPGPEENGLWNAAVIGLRSMGKTDAEVFAWFQTRSIGKFLLPVNDGEPLVMAFLVDRGPNDLLLKFLSGREDMTALYVPWFAEGSRLLKLGRHEDAYRTFLTRLAGPEPENLQRFRYALPAFAWSGVRCGNAHEVEAWLGRYRDELGEDFHYRLALALLKGGRGDTEGAAAELRKARFAMEVNYPPIDFSFPWYQLLEAAEWLHGQSGQQPYADLLAAWPQICQKLYPTEGWTYAMEALHAPSQEERTRALALASFMDPNGERIAGASAAEREAARVWLRENNPFGAKREGAGGTTTF